MFGHPNFLSRFANVQLTKIAKFHKQQSICLSTTGTRRGAARGTEVRCGRAILHAHNFHAFPYSDIILQRHNTVSIAKVRININVILCFVLIKSQPMRINWRQSHEFGLQKMWRFPQISKLKTTKESAAKRGGYRGDSQAKGRAKNGPAKNVATINAELGYIKSYINIQSLNVNSNHLCRRM